jgi:uncharacterized repeat protein (TIGR01451 family)
MHLSLVSRLANPYRLRVHFALFTCVALTAAAHHAHADGFVATGSLLHARSSHTATLLASGRVLVADGIGSGAVLNSAELYDPVTRTWAATGSNSYNRYGHTATLLQSGKVLLVGGYGTTGPVAAAELYDPAAATWSLAATPSIPRQYHTATLLASGKVLVAGGFGFSTQLASAQLYDPVANTWTATGSMLHARTAHNATLLPSGKVLVTGGSGGSGVGYLVADEIYDPASGQWSAAAPMNTGRVAHTSTVLPNDHVLIAGGTGGDGTIGLASAELFDIVANTWSPAGRLGTTRVNATATLLSSGGVLVVGGTVTPNSTFLASAELYDVASSAFHAAGALADARYLHTATLLNDGSVLIAGGQNSTGVLGSAELYAPVTSTLIDSIAPTQTVVGELYAVAVSVSGAGTPSGQITIADEAGASCGPVDLVGGSGSCSLASTSAGTRSLTATYLPATSAFAPSSGTATHVVIPADTQLAIASETPDPSTPVAPVTVSATLGVVSPGAGTPTGTIVVSDGVDSCEILVGSADSSCTLALSTHGLRTLTASYTGNGNFNASSAQTTHLVNTPPALAAPTYSTNEDTPLAVSAAQGLLSFAHDDDGDTLTIVEPGTLTPDGIGGSLAIAEDGSFVYTPPADANGSASFGYSVSDGYTTQSVTASLTVTAVNDPPSFVLAASPTWPSGASGQRQQSGFASVTSLGGPDEAGQQTSWILRTIGDPDGVTSGVSVLPDGSLNYTLTGHAGSASFGLSLRDDGGSANGGVDTSPEQFFSITVAAGLDLQISIDDGSAYAQGGLPVDYTITVVNHGPDDAIGAHVRDALPSNLVAASWTCAPTGTASCTAAGDGDIDDVVDLPNGGALTYQLSATVLADPEVPIENTVSVTPPAGVPDANTANNSATDSDTVGIFADGFDTSRPMAMAPVEASRPTQTISLDARLAAASTMAATATAIVCRVGDDALLVQQRIEGAGIVLRRLALRDADGWFIYSPWAVSAPDAVLAWTSMDGRDIESVQLAQGTSPLIEITRPH